MKYIFKKRSNILFACLLDAVGYGVRSIWPRKLSAIQAAPGHFLVIRLDHIGDVLSSTALPKILKEHFPASRVYFLTSSWAAPLLENNPFLDEVLVYDTRWFQKKNYADVGKKLRLFPLIKAVRRLNVGVGIGLRGDLRENFFMAFCGMKERIGYGITGGGFCLTREVPYSKGVHETTHTLDLLNALGIRTASLEPQLYFAEREREAFRSRLEKSGIVLGEACVGFQVDAGTKAKEWPPEHAAAFLDQFLAGHGDRRIVLVGSDKRKADLISNAHADDPRLVNLVGQTSLRELAALLKELKLFIGPDSGPSHLALALGVKTILLYSGTNVYAQWKPLSERAVVLKKEVDCSPCGLEVCTVAGHPCMSRTTPEELLSTVLENL